MRHYCKRCGGTMDTGEAVHYPGVGDVCEERAQELDQEAAHRELFSLTKRQQQDIKNMVPGILLGA